MRAARNCSARSSPTRCRRRSWSRSTRKKAHPLYGRVISIRKKFYAHDEKNEAHVGDYVRIEETRPLSRLKRWQLKDIVRKTALVPEDRGNRDRDAPLGRKEKRTWR